MRVMIFSAGVGSGHNQVAKTIRDSVLQNPGNTVELLDVIKTISPFLSKVVLDSYLVMLRHIPSMWGLLHDQFDSSKVKEEPYTLMNHFLARELNEYIADFKPDIIVNTHPFASNLMGTLRQRGKTKCPVASIITEYNIHSMWIHSYIDRFYVAAPLLGSFVNMLSIPESKIVSTGMPVRKQFYEVKQKSVAEVRKTLTLSNKPTLLFMGGGLGLGDITDVLYYTDQKISGSQIMVVCGSNEELYDMLAAKEWNNRILLMRFVDNVAELMYTSDIVITKPGGVTCTEALSLGRPLALISPIPGQETRNQHFFLNNGVAVSVPSNKYAGYIIDDLLQDKQRRALMSQLAVRIGNIHADLDIIRDWDNLLGESTLDTTH